jgi:hypothetical protein
MPNRRSTLVTLAAAVLAALVVGGVLGVRVSGDPGGTSSPPADGSAATDAPTDSVPAGAELGSGTSHAETGQRGSESMSEQTSDGSAGGTSTRSARGGVVVVPEQPGPATGYRLPAPGPASTTRGPAYVLPAAAASARGRLVAGYPARLLPVAPRSEVVSSSVAPTADRAQVALVARRSLGPAAVLRSYRTQLGRAGFREVTVEAVGGADAAAFRRGADRVVVTVDPGPARTYSVYATLVAGEA